MRTLLLLAGGLAGLAVAAPGRAAGADVTLKVIVQNEVSDTDKITDIKVHLSTRTSPNAGQLEEVAVPDVAAGSGQQSEKDVSGLNQRFRWARLTYKVGTARVAQTGAFVVARSPGSNRDHYILQVIFRVKTPDGSLTQAQIDEKPNPSGFESEADGKDRGDKPDKK